MKKKLTMPTFSLESLQWRPELAQKRNQQAGPCRPDSEEHSKYRDIILSEPTGHLGFVLRLLKCSDARVRTVSDRVGLATHLKILYDSGENEEERKELKEKAGHGQMWNDDEEEEAD
ncbi:hypothetical protein MVEN_00847800 [Mycena venus]|uniref:Uncharacterized protein n=1 Tax=Mycena venus TaxID=2733690 RepID=A0A8H6YBJ2_9AGAR|nr:hypothetical protein MVEN_00847800 [Mycena venus]